MKKILFTGARSGIAAAVIAKLLQKDYFIYVTTHTKQEEKSCKEKYKNYDNISCFKLDITNHKDKEKLKNLDVDILVSNAATGYGGSIIEMPINTIRKNYEVNVFSNFEVIQIVLKNMIKKRNGKIIIIASLAGIIPIEFLGSYCSTKASVIMLAKVLKKELKLLNTNIKIKVIEPGIYKTGFNEVMLDNKDLSNSLYFKDKISAIQFKEYIMFDLMNKKKLDSITKQIIKSIQSNNNKFTYSSPISQKLFSKIYQIFKG